jgi:hypothetical protein
MDPSQPQGVVVFQEPQSWNASLMAAQVSSFVAEGIDDVQEQSLKCCLYSRASSSVLTRVDGFHVWETTLDSFHSHIAIVCEVNGTG